MRKQMARDGLCVQGAAAPIAHLRPRFCHVESDGMTVHHLWLTSYVGGHWRSEQVFDQRSECAASACAEPLPFRRSQCEQSSLPHHARANHQGVLSPKHLAKTVMWMAWALVGFSAAPRGSQQGRSDIVCCMLATEHKTHMDEPSLSASVFVSSGFICRDTTR